SSAAVASRQPGFDVTTVDATTRCLMSREVDYGIKDVWDDMVGDLEERASTTIEGLSQRSEARNAWETLSHSMNYNKPIHAELQAYRAQILEAREPELTRDPEPYDGLTDAGSTF
ncbi:hypothetical protein Tco_1322909, partial [Tanacetum coccineum]